MNRVFRPLLFQHLRSNQYTLLCPRKQLLLKWQAMYLFQRLIFFQGRE